ncbi:MAG TPA: 3-dehydroquinate synthase [Bacillota bacterium]|nr:3-dehydroquinate synthase [Bacillota bacterium]
MSLIEQTIEISFQHRVYFSRNVFEPKNTLLRQVLRVGEGEPTPKALIVLDESLHRAQPDLASRIETYFSNISPLVKLVCPPVILEGGERVKNSYFHVSEIQSHLDRYHLDRHSFLFGIGGGALLDVVGLAAATAHRGMRHVRLPSTTLAQADSGVGVKNGINAFGKKNFIGTFAVPFAVINDFDLLASLAPRDKRAGYIEAVKVACIRDAAFFAEIEQAAGALRAFEPEAMQRLIYRCAELHVHHIATGGDPFEMGSARPLDFGHWAAHKLEQLSEYKLRHGEAVAIGMALDVIYSQRIGLLDAPSAERILKLMQELGFDLFASELLNVGAGGGLMILRGLDEFREHLGGQLTVTLLKAIGQGIEVHAIDQAIVSEAIRDLQRGQGGKVSVYA